MILFKFYYKLLQKTAKIAQMKPISGEKNEIFSLFLQIHIPNDDFIIYCKKYQNYQKLSKNIIFLGENYEKYSFKVSRLLYRREGSIAMYNHFNSLHHSNEIVTIPIKVIGATYLMPFLMILYDFNENCYKKTLF